MPIVTRPRFAAEAALVVSKYRRVSTLDQLDGFGLEDQDRLNNSWLDRNPAAVVFGDYVDEAVSGALESRPDMDRLVADAHKGSFNRILVPKVDRIGRTARAAYNWAWQMADIGVYFISVTEGIDTSTEQGWAMFQQYVNFAEMEWRRIRERTFNGREMKMSFGGWPGGPCPYGYALVNDTSYVGGKKKRFSVLVTDEGESKVLHVAVSLVVDDGMNLTEAAAELNNRKLFTRSGVPWTAANLRGRLYSETIHYGYVIYRKTTRGNGKNTTHIYEDGTPVYGEQVKIAVPSIFSQDRVDALMVALKKIGFKNGRKKNSVYPLSGRIVGRCGRVYTGVGQNSVDARAYRCKGTLDKENPCNEPYLRAEDVEDAIWRELTKLLSDETRLQDMAREWASSLPGDKDKYLARVADLREKINGHEVMIATKVPEYIRAGIDPKVAVASVRTFEDELKEFQKQLDFAKQWLEESAEYERQSATLVEIANNAKGRLANATPEQRADIFEMFNLSVEPGSWDNVRKSGSRCHVSEWHWETGTLVPPDPTAEEWGHILNVIVAQHFAKKSLKSKYDLQALFCGALHRLRHGISWIDMPPEFGPREAIRDRQLQYFKRGAWQEIMAFLKANDRGVPAYKRPMIPPLTVTGQLRAGLLAQVETEAPADLAEGAIPGQRKTSNPTTSGIVVESPMRSGAGFKLFIR